MSNTNKSINGGTKIRISDIKNLINQVINESLELGEYSNFPILDDENAKRLAKVKQIVAKLINMAKSGNAPKDTYILLGEIEATIMRMINHPELDAAAKSRMEHDYEGVLGSIHQVLGGAVR